MHFASRLRSWRFSWGSVGLTAALLLGGLLVSAGVAELVLRAYARLGGTSGARLADYDPLAVKVELYGTVGYRQRPNASLRYFNGTVANANALGYRGPAITRAKPEGVLRIVLMGGSTTHGWGVDDSATIDAYMRQRLAERTEQRFEVINAAMDGYDSLQLLERLQGDVISLNPDLLIINCGINDVRNARFPNLTHADPRTLVWRGLMERMRREQIHGRSWWTTAKHYSLLFRLPSFVVSNAQQGAAIGTTVTGYPEAADYFEKNLRSIADIALTRGMKLIFSTPPSALRTRYAPNAPPEKSYWLRDAETTAQYRDTLAARMRSVATELAARGAPILYLRPQVPPGQFLDDAHLTAQGNASVAEVFSDAAMRLLRP